MEDSKYFIEKTSTGCKIIAGFIKESRLERFEVIDDNSIEKDVFRVRVEEMNPGLDAAFIDIGRDKRGFLPLAGGRLKSGQIVLAQVKRDEYDEKGAVLSRDISIDGRYIVLTPNSYGIKASRKLKNAEQIKSELIDERRYEYGFVLRNSCEEVEREKIVSEYDELTELYEELVRQLNYLPIPKRVYSHGNGVERYLRRENPVNTELVTNDEDVFELAKKLGYIKTKYIPDFSVRYDKTISDDLKRATSEAVTLRDGAWISIESTKAAFVIDVNGGSSREISKDRQSASVNEDAAKEIARQIKLRNLSGIIVIDFIGTEIDDKICDILKYELKDDPNTPKVLGVTKAGLVEVVRKRRGRILDIRMEEIL